MKYVSLFSFFKSTLLDFFACTEKHNLKKCLNLLEIFFGLLKEIIFIRSCLYLGVVNVSRFGRISELRNHSETPIPRRRRSRTHRLGNRRLDGIHQEVAPVANPNRMWKSDLRKRERVGGTPPAEDTAACPTVMSTPKNGERVGATETVGGEGIGDPGRGSADNDVVVDVFLDRMLRNDFRDFFSSTRCDVEKGGFRLVELVGRRHRELVDELVLGNVEPEILAVDGSGIFLTGRRAAIRRWR